MAAKTLIVSKVGVKTPGYTRVYIGRGTLFGNPFKICASADREKVIEFHRRWLNEQRIKRTPHWLAVEGLAKAVDGGDKLALICHCAPLDCHGNTLVKAIEWLLANKEPVVA